MKLKEQRERNSLRLPGAGKAAVVPTRSEAEADHGNIGNLRLIKFSRHFLPLS